MHTPRRRSRRPLTTVAGTSALALAAAMVPGAAFAVDATATVADVQGTGEASPLVGETVTVEAVVTADHRGEDGFEGLYLQTAGSGGAEDATPNASDGVFAFLGESMTSAEVGDLVSVTGVVSEFSGLTQIDVSMGGGTITVLDGEAALPAPTDLPADVVGAAREQYEGMLVTPTGEYRVASTHQVASLGTVWLSAGADPLVVGTEVADADDPRSDEIAAANAARRLLLDDGLDVRVGATTQPYLDGTQVVRTGDGVAFPEAPYVLSFGFDEWRLQPVLPLDASAPADRRPTFVPLNPRPAAPAEVGGDVRLGAFNVLDYFTTLTTDDPDARGARSPELLAVQRSKIVAALTALDADVVALQEIENSVHFGDGTPDVALADLVAALDTAAGADEWAYVPTPAPLVGPDAAPTDVIMNALVYRPAAVTPVGESRTVVDEEVWDNAREPVAQIFTPTAGGAPFTVIANHFTSKGVGPDDVEEPEEGFFTEDRVAQATSVTDLAFLMRTLAESDDVAVLGDLNAYSQEDPVQVFLDQGWVDVVAAEAPGDHTYTFDGELGSLDHALMTPPLAARVAGADVWNINAPEWSGLEYFQPFTDSGSVYRSSDHDPLLVGISAQAATPTVEVDVLAINDFHGRLEPGGGTSPVAGAAVLAGAVESFRAANPDTVFVSAGDNIGASTFTSFVQDDVPTLQALNAMGLDASAAGNHEFDRGWADLEGRVDDLAEFPYLAANVYDRATGEPALEEYALEEVDGVTVGFIGAVTEDLPTLVTPKGIEDLEVRDVVDEVNRVAALLSDGDGTNGEADVLVLLVHEGAPSTDVADLTADTAFGRIATLTSPEVDAIVSAHTHQRYDHRLPVEGWPAGLTRPVVQGGQYGEALDHLTFTVDPATGEIVGIESEIVELAPDGVAQFTPDAEVAAIVADAVAVADVLGARSLGTITGDFLRAQGTPVDGAPAENRGGESTLGNLVADVQLWATTELGTQIAFMNPGGLRADLAYASSGPEDPDGNVTYREAATVQPFANTLVTMDLTGAQVVQVLEEQWQPEGTSRPFLKLGVSEGLEYVYDPTAPAGERISRVTLDGVELDPAAAYTVVTNSFLASGGDNFATLSQGADPQDSGRVDLQAFVDYMAAFPGVTPDLEQRAVGVHVVDEPADGTWAPGDAVTVELSSLLFSAGEPQGTTLTVTVDGEAAGTVAVDPSVVDGTDEVGRATVQVTVPADAVDGTLEVVATVDGTGTTVTVPLTVDAPDAEPEPEPDPLQWLIDLIEALLEWLYRFFGWPPPCSRSPTRW